MICKRCGKEAEDNKAGRPRLYCPDCVQARRSEYFREWYAKNGFKRNRYGNYSEAVREWQRNNPEKVKAHKKVAWALRWGKLVNPGECSKCGKKTNYLDAHHEDYRKPLKVTWLCISCHRKRHTENRVYWNWK